MTRHDLEVSPNMPLLWAIRDLVGLTGTKFGCGGAAVRSCQVPVSAAVGQPAIAPGVANSLSKLTGKRYRKLPFLDTVKTA
jgi:isoquinoline 1-oxidoreductase subunit alpha